MELQCPGLLLVGPAPHQRRLCTCGFGSLGPRRSLGLSRPGHPRAACRQNHSPCGHVWEQKPLPSGVGNTTECREGSSWPVPDGCDRLMARWAGGGRIHRRGPSRWSEGAGQAQESCRGFLELSCPCINLSGLFLWRIKFLHIKKNPVC